MKKDNTLLKEVLENIPSRNTEQYQAYLEDIFVDVFEDDHEIFAQENAAESSKNNEDDWVEKLDVNSLENEESTASEAWDISDENQSENDEIYVEELNMDDFWDPL